MMILFSKGDKDIKKIMCRDRLSAKNNLIEKKKQ